MGSFCSEKANIYCAAPYRCLPCTPDGYSRCHPPITAATSTQLTVPEYYEDGSYSYDYGTTPDQYDYYYSMSTTPARIQAQILGNPCVSVRDCVRLSQLHLSLFSNPLCFKQTVLFSNCVGGRCICEDGYAARGNHSCIESFERFPLGATCDSRFDLGRCGPANSTCLNSRCTCRQGFRQGPKADCVEENQTQFLDQSCSTSSQCFYNLLCIDYRCQCSPGYKATSSFTCSKRILGDVCSTPLDCRFIANSTCSRRGRCSCLPSFTRANANQCDPLIVEQYPQLNNQLRMFLHISLLFRMPYPIFIYPFVYVSKAVPCQIDVDCISPAAPALSRCFNGFCQCPPNHPMRPDQFSCEFTPSCKFSSLPIYNIVFIYLFIYF